MPSPALCRDANASNDDHNPGGWVAPMETSRAEIVVRQSAGEGGAILLIHSQGGGSREFEALFRSSLAAERRLIAINLPGHGGSGEAYYPATTGAVDVYAEVALEVLERLGVETAFVIDRWNGGAIGRELMAIFPGMLGLGVEFEASQGGDWTSDLVPVFALPDLSLASLEPALKCARLREVALSLQRELAL